MPALSFIIPTKDRAAELAQTLATLEAQTCGDWEAIVVDDASAEDVRACVDRSKDPRIRYLRLPVDKKGAPAGRNWGVQQALGEFAIFLDSDDAVAAHCAARRLEVMRNHDELDFAVFQCACFVDQPGDLPFLWNTFTGRPGETDLDRFLSRDVVWQTTSPIWRRSALCKFAPWNEEAPSGQDWEFHSRALIARLKYKKFDELDCYWRRPTENRQSIGKQTFERQSAAQHARGRPGTIDVIRKELESAGLMTPARRRMLVGMYFAAIRRMAQTGSFRESRKLWARLFRQGLIDLKDLLAGGLFLLTGRSAVYTATVEALLDRHWDAIDAVRRRPQYLLHRINPSVPPAVSVLMLLGDHWRTAEEAIRSLMSQQWQDFELIVVDQSRDLSGDIARRVAATDARILVLRRDPRMSPGAMLAEALSQARGELVARMSAQGSARSLRLARQVEFLRENRDCALVGCRVRCKNERSEDLGDEIVPPTDPACIRARLARGESEALPWATALMRSSAVRDAGGYRDVVEPDMDLFRRLAERADVANLPEALMWHTRVRAATAPAVRAIWRLLLP